MMDDDDDDPHTEEARKEELHDEKRYYTVSASVKTSSQNIGPYSDLFVPDYFGKEGRNIGPYSDLLVAKTDEQKKVAVTPQQKSMHKKRERMGEDAFLAERAEYARERRLRIKTMGKPRVKSTTYAAVRKRIQRERAALKKRETESVATINATITNKATTQKATPTAEAAAILAGIASVTVPTVVNTVDNTVDTNSSASNVVNNRYENNRKNINNRTERASSWSTGINTNSSTTSATDTVAASTSWTAPNNTAGGASSSSSPAKKKRKKSSTKKRKKSCDSITTNKDDSSSVAADPGIPPCRSVTAWAPNISPTSIIMSTNTNTAPLSVPLSLRDNTVHTIAWPSQNNNSINNATATVPNRTVPDSAQAPIHVPTNTATATIPYRTGPETNTATATVPNRSIPDPAHAHASIHVPRNTATTGTVPPIQVPTNTATATVPYRIRQETNTATATATVPYKTGPEHAHAHAYAPIHVPIHVPTNTATARIPSSVVASHDDDNIMAKRNTGRTKHNMKETNKNDHDNGSSAEEEEEDDEDRVDTEEVKEVEDEEETDDEKEGDQHSVDTEEEEEILNDDDERKQHSVDTEEDEEEVIDNDDDKEKEQKRPQPADSFSHQKNALQNNSTYMYYPIYNGWVAKTIPIFETTTEAICWQLSRMMKDSITHSEYHHKELRWARVCGRIDKKNISPKPYNIIMNAMTERQYFCNTKFHQICTNLKSIHTKIVMMTEETFLVCLDTFKKIPDYQSSSGSIFRTKCIRNNNTDAVSFIPKNLNHIPQRKNELGMFSIISKSVVQNHLSKKDYSITTICNIMKKICDHNIKKDRIIVSLCCGTAATELNSEEICLCLDINRRHLSSACVNTLRKSKKLILFSYFDYSSDDLKQLLQQLKETTKKHISVLYQHPSPSPTIADQFSKSCSIVAAALVEGYVGGVCMVYDHKSTGNSWTETSINKAFFQGIQHDNKTLIKSTKSTTIAGNGSDIVEHPYFGSINRLGWAKMKKGEERTIFFNCTSKKLNRNRERKGER